VRVREKKTKLVDLTEVVKRGDGKEDIIEKEGKKNNNKRKTTN